MAIVKYLDEKDEVITAEVGAMIWKVLNGELEPDEEQQAFVEKVKTVHLNFRNAPDSYIKARLPMIIPTVLQEWMVDANGNPTKPESEFAWTFSRRWGLWEHGAPTSLVRKYIKPRRVTT